MMLANIFEQIEYLSTAFTLEPGDLIATGTPEGVGIAMDPPTFLKVGDVVRCEIDGIGAIENEVIAARSSTIYLPCNARYASRSCSDSTRSEERSGGQQFGRKFRLRW